MLLHLKICFIFIQLTNTVLCCLFLLLLFAVSSQFNFQSVTNFNQFFFLKAFFLLHFWWGMKQRNSCSPQAFTVFFFFYCFHLNCSLDLVERPKSAYCCATHLSFPFPMPMATWHVGKTFLTFLHLIELMCYSAHFSSLVLCAKIDTAGLKIYKFYEPAQLSIDNIDVPYGFPSSCRGI